MPDSLQKAAGLLEDYDTSVSESYIEVAIFPMLWKLRRSKLPAARSGESSNERKSNASKSRVLHRPKGRGMRRAVRIQEVSQIRAMGLKLDVETV